MREIHTDQIIRAVREMCLEANYDLDPEVMRALEEALSIEESPIGRDVLRQLIENARIAREERVPMCRLRGGYRICGDRAGCAPGGRLLARGGQ